MKKVYLKCLKYLVDSAEKAAKRADGRASEYGVYQPKKPKDKK